VLRQRVHEVDGSWQLRRNVNTQPLKDGEPLVPDVLAVGAAHNIVAVGREGQTGSVGLATPLPALP
jgi:hypothetical protein